MTLASDRSNATLSGTRGFTVSAASPTVRINLVCSSSATALVVFDANLTATYAPVDPELGAGG